MYPRRDRGRSCRLHNRLERGLRESGDLEDTMTGSINALGAMSGRGDSRHDQHRGITTFQM